MALTEQEKKELYQKQLAITDEEFLAMDEVEFRARFRERVHHTLEIQTYSTAYRKRSLSKAQADYSKRLIHVWEQRGLSTELPDYVYAKKLIEYAEELSEGKELSLEENTPKPVTKEVEDNFFQVMYNRRSVREYLDKEVPDELIEKVLDAGLWAAHSCNLQSIRYLVIREKNEPGLFKGSDVPGGPVHLVVLQDLRVYKANRFMPDKNILLDAGAAAQNIALAAHAVGLEGVWLTFNDKMINRLRDYFKLPEYIDIVTYVDVGYGDQTPYPPLRNSAASSILGNI